MFSFCFSIARTNHKKNYHIRLINKFAMLTAQATQLEESCGEQIRSLSHRLKEVQQIMKIFSQLYRILRLTVEYIWIEALDL